MACSARVDVDPGATLSPPAGGAGMIEVDVRHENVANLLRIEAGIRDAIQQVGKGGSRPGLDQDQTAVTFHQVAGDGTGCFLKVQVKGVNPHAAD